MSPVVAAWCSSMSAMGAMPMPGGWTLSMTWTRAPGQTWPGAAASFLGMWVAMTAAMMLPSVVPTLWRYRRSVVLAGGKQHPGLLTTLVGAGYLLVWAMLGLAAFPLGVALAAAAMDRPALSRAAPMAAAVVVLTAGVWQRSAWKARHLAACLRAPDGGRPLPAGAGTALRQGLRVGLDCARSCANLTAILLAVGVMDLRAMAIVGTAITVERLAPGGARVARATGVVAMGAGLYLLARAAALG